MSSRVSLTAVERVRACSRLSASNAFRTAAPVTQFQIQGSGDHGLRRQETAQREGQTVRLRGRHYGAEIAGHYNTTRFALPDRVLRCR